MEIIDGKALAKKNEEYLFTLIKNKNIHPKLVIISCDPDNASGVYMKNKTKAAKRIGIECEIIKFEPSSNTEEMVEKIYKLNEDDKVSGIIVQLPLPKHFDVVKIQKAISPRKDVDGFHPNSLFTSCTPLACMRMLREYNLNVDGKHCVVIGRSEIVGKPLAKLLLNANATVTQCHSHTSTEMLKNLCKQADFVFAAAGKTNLIQPDYLKDGVVLIDISINRDENGNLCGDAAKECAEKCSYISPVPGGVGPMTVNTLMWNTVSACIAQENISLDSF